MDFHSDDYQYNTQNRPPIQPRDMMLSAAVILSAIAVATSCCVYASLICGALSITLAFLSRGQQKKLTPQGRLAVTTSVVAIILSVGVTIGMILSTIHQYGSFENFMKAYTELMESMTGST